MKKLQFFLGVVFLVVGGTITSFALLILLVGGCAVKFFEIMGAPGQPDFFFNIFLIIGLSCIAFIGGALCVFGLKIKENKRQKIENNEENPEP